jgi:hypothetical protein
VIFRVRIEPYKRTNADAPASFPGLPVYKFRRHG